MTQISTADCIELIDQQLNDIRHIEEDCEFGEQDDKPVLQAIRAKLLAADEMAETLFKVRKPWPHEMEQLDDMVDKALTAWREAGGTA